MKETLTKILARYIYSLSYKNIPKKAIEKAKDLILDNLGVAYGGYGMRQSQIAIELIKDKFESMGNTTVIAHKFKAAAADSAFANSVMMHSMQQDDVHWPTGTHAGSVIIPAALSLGEAEEKTGIDVLTSIVIGYDIVGKLGKTMSTWEIPRRSTTVFGMFGAAAVAAKLLDLDEEQTANALGYAANFSMGLGECLRTGTTEWSFQNGMTTHNGIISAFLGKSGATTAETTMEGKFGFFNAFLSRVPENIGQVISDLGRKFEIFNVKSKPYPSCACNHTSIEVMQNMVQDYDLNAENIDKIKVHIAKSASRVPGLTYCGPFETMGQAVISLPFAMAVVVLDKKYTPERCTKKYGDARLNEIAKTVEIIPEDNRERASARIDVIKRNSEHYTEELSEWRESTRKDFEEKLARYASGIISREKISQIICYVADLDQVENISLLTECLA